MLLIVGMAYFVRPDLFTGVPALLGPLPVGVIWFGALGAVLISLTGIFEHHIDWDPTY